MKITRIKGIGPKKEERLAVLGIREVEDLLYFFPRAYEDRRKITAINDLKESQWAVVQGKVVKIIGGNPQRRSQTLRLVVENQGGRMEMVFFHGRYAAREINPGQVYYFYGRPQRHRGVWEMIHPDFSTHADFLQIVPLYPLTRGLSQKELRRWQKEAQRQFGIPEEYLPPDILEKRQLLPLGETLKAIHFPSNPLHWKQAKNRILYEDLFLFQLGTRGMRRSQGKGIAFEKKGEDALIRSLPFSLTDAQGKVAQEVMADMESHDSMNRLIQGDVGSGKTVIAALALYKAAINGYQGAMMVPTEILLRQHKETLSEQLEPLGLVVECLSGSMKAKEKKEILERLKQGHIHILIGTHALIEKQVDFHRLGLVITDEQHRFGVQQRAYLSQKGERPDILVMTATPIPRTLARVLYKETDLSVIDQRPPGRKPIKTKAVWSKNRKKAYEFANQQMEQGRQVYVVTPLIAPSEPLELQSAEELYKELKRKFPQRRIGLVHGAMTSPEKSRVMEAFAVNEIEMLVSTVVIEVGIDVPNATVMIIENAERFGLAQLHQLRGRVGRGKEESYCLLISAFEGKPARERAKTLVESNDGFVIAERDLTLRGPGEFFGYRQHGIPDERWIAMVSHPREMEMAREDVEALLQGMKETKDSLPLPLQRRLKGYFDGNLLD